MFASAVIDAEGPVNAQEASAGVVAEAVRLRQLGATDPRAAKSQLYDKLLTLEAGDADRLPLLDVLAEVTAAMHDHEGEVAARQQALWYRVSHLDERASVTSILTAYVGLTQALMHASRYKDALDILAEGRRAVATRIGPALVATLGKMEAQLHDCAGDEVAAFRSLVAALAAQERSGVTLTAGQMVDDVLLQLRVLSHVRAAAEEAEEEAGHDHSGDGSAPPHVAHDHAASAGGNATLLRSLAAAVAPKMTSLVNALVARGPWTLPNQLPRAYEPGLRAQPWWSPSDVPGWDRIVQELNAAVPALAHEYRTLVEHDMLRHEHECIVDAAGGQWRYMQVLGPEVTSRGVYGCALNAPAACNLLDTLNSAGLRHLHILRAGYSVLDADATLRPHYGITNGQLKFHVGVIVPRDAATGAPCAFLTVAGEPRPWATGKTLFFDDSFEHSVRSTCRRTRVIFQLVVAHPDLVAAGRPLPFSAPPRNGPANGAFSQPNGH